MANNIVSHRVHSDLFTLENIVQQTGCMHGKNLLIDELRSIFSQDREFCYRSDAFGFPLTPSHLGLDPEAGLSDEETTRIFIGSSYRYDVKFNPSITVRNTGSRYVPISFNQNLLSIINRLEKITDGYGNSSYVYTPTYSTIVGAWDQTFEVKIVTENEVDREEISDIVQATLMGTRRMALQQAGLFIKTLNTAGETEEKYANDYTYAISINLECRSEWKVHIPLNNVVERIGFLITFGNGRGNTSNGLEINDILTTVDTI